DRHAPAIVVAPRARDVERIRVAARVVAVVDVGTRIGGAAAAARRAPAAGTGTARGRRLRHAPPVGRRDLADVELLRAVAAERAGHGHAVADADRILDPALTAQVRDVAALQLPVRRRAVLVADRQAITHVGVREPDARDLALQLARVTGVEL